MATAIYNKVQIAKATDPFVRPFRFKGIYEILADHPELICGSSSTQHHVRSGGEESTGGGAEGNVDDIIRAESERRSSEKLARPTGRNLAKDLLTKRIASKKKLRVAAETLEVQKDRNVALNRYNDIILFSHLQAGVNPGETEEFVHLMHSESLTGSRARL
ncbi:unnamed protein product [Agarophyton chilense]|eukprot:gb/GEZJ01004678.1/.p1 GENE.gb/GEZJ01004678.1/~~gb/GEZJ01004678.1/.p1  ORF type:complete len:161 (-),score=23.71 gb/GEZJ01004678.1/:1655-2137(-)